MSTIGQENTQKTIFHSLTEVTRSMGLDYTPPVGTTYNQKMGSLPGYLSGGAVTPPVGLDPSEYPTIKYLAIGRGAHRVVLSDNQFDIVKHRCSDATPFEPIPWLVRPLGQDIDDATRANYRLRVVRDIGGNPYVCYYLRVIDLNATTPTVDVITVQDGEIASSVAYDFAAEESAMQDPIPPTQSNLQANLINGRHIRVSSTVTITMDENDINEIIEACELIYGSVNYATISEFGVVQGVDYNNYTVNTGGDGDDPLTYVEAVNTQITTHIGVIIPLQGRPTQITNSYALSDVIPWPEASPT